MSNQTAIVVGGGVIGSFTAYYLTELGWSVTLLERDRIGSGASHGNCGYICPSHAMPLSGPGVVAKTLPTLLKRDSALSIPPRFDPALWSWLLRFRSECTRDKMLATARGRAALLNLSKQLYDGLFADGILQCEYKPVGLLNAYRSQRDFEQFAATADLLQNEFGIETTRFDGDAVTRFEPALKPGLAGGWLYPNDGHVRPDKLMSSLHTELLNRGVNIHERTTVELFQIETHCCRGVKTSAGQFDADAVILANGAEASRWSKTLGCPVAVQPGKGYSMTMPALPHQPQVPIIFEESHVAVTPLENAFRVGSTMEFAGYSRELNPRRIALLRRAANSHLVDDIPEQVDETWCGWRPMSADGLPFLGPVPAASNLHLAAGNGMIGLATGSGTGKLVAQLVAGVETSIDPIPYRPNRFA